VTIPVKLFTSQLFIRIPYYYVVCHYVMHHAVLPAHLVWWAWQQRGQPLPSFTKRWGCSASDSGLLTHCG